MHYNNSDTADMGAEASKFYNVKTVKTSPIQLLETGGVNQQLQSMMKSMNDSIAELANITSTDSITLQNDYKSFMEKIQTYINVDNLIDTSPLTPGDALNKARGDLIALDERRDAIINNYVNQSGDFWSAVISEFKYYCKMATYVLGPILGFIIMTNTFFDEKITFKLFYGLFGALWYPLSVLFAIFVPPVWRALFIPLVKTDLPVSLFEFWKYNVTIDLDVTAKSQTMMRLICIGFAILFGYSFLV